MIQEVLDEEILYRCIFHESSDGIKNYLVQDGKVLVSYHAFRDPQKKPSVDRACLCQFKPNHSQKNIEDGVVSLLCKSIRSIDSISYKENKISEPAQCRLDIIYDPKPDNNAHSQIEYEPGSQSGSVFDRIKKGLMSLVNSTDNSWEILPIDLR